MTVDRLRYYIRGQSTSLPRYILEQTAFALLSWVPGLVGIALRAACYRLLLRCDGLPAIESGVRLVQPGNISLGPGVYLDHATYLHACPGGIQIGAETFIMLGTELHVYNFRDLPHAGISIGQGCIIGERNIIRGSGGVKIGDHVLTAPGVQILSSNHLYGDPTLPIMEQGVSTEGITIEDGGWIGAGAIILDGVRIGRNSVIGAGAVVTHDVPPYGIALGSPAEVVGDTRSDAAPNRRTQQAESHLDMKPSVFHSTAQRNGGKRR
jgi:acetyltransferase-like isoleucine patch superfamily enzyme